MVCLGLDMMIDVHIYTCIDDPKYLLVEFFGWFRMRITSSLLNECSKLFHDLHFKRSKYYSLDKHSIQNKEIANQVIRYHNRTI